ncbi:hypothetical protein SELMODRAFT_75450 [Selaginella moellendorffii]|uniref:Uncharacterized protein n=1 Tax=Selaginella moellendorffii TaxID=88036 RepID=D8QQ81_SELML|nr:hypothetical protein SELMODRAFT_87239 [Selaginella moellendorffii]EFJ38415.1 hypothetical protein SELMODRAFT_75450 [Selaginella moellendorffii]
MRASFDSEATSLGPSPPQSPRHPVYFVQSPSRDSHDGDYKPSVQSTPMISPSASPMHHSFVRSSNASSADTVSGQHKLGSRKVLPQPSYGSDAHGRGGYRKKGYKPWVPGGTIMEEEEQMPGAAKKGLSRCCMCGLSFLGCVLVFGFIAMIFWLVCRPRAPELRVKDIIFNEFFVVDGSAQGVPTRVLTANCTIKVMFHNPSKYFGLHVSDSDVTLDYTQLSVGTGKATKFYQAKNSKRAFSVNVVAVRIPLYGAGPNLQSLTQAGGGVPLQIKAALPSRAYVFGKLVKPKFRSYFSCDVTVNSSGKNFLKLLGKQCTYTAPPKP